MTEAYLVGGVRTPVGRYGGALSSVRADDLAALVVGEAVRRAGLDPAAIDEVILGAANQAGEDNRNVARMAVLLAGLPLSTSAYTVNRLCASGLTAIANAAQAVKSGEADIVIAGGVESMTRAPWVMAKPERAFGKPGEMVDSSLGWRFVNSRFRARDKATFSMTETGEYVGVQEGITRADADAFALRSHQRAVSAVAAGKFEAEIVPVATPSGEIVSVDEGPRGDTSLEVLAGLKPVVPGGSIVTAGNSSPLNDGSAAVLIASDAAIRRYGLTPRARVIGGASVGVAPEVMGLGPIPATRKLLGRLGLTADQIDAVELNEAFATQALACVRQLGFDEAIVNADGGAIALGHPLGASGTRILVTLLGRLERGGMKTGLATMCVGVGQGAALLVEAV
jgi:acetyl-CoA C-acetyltransferase